MRLDTSTDPQVGYRPPGALEANPLGEFRGAFARRQAAHLLRRAGFGGTPGEIDALAGLGMEGAVASLMHPTTQEVEFVDYPDAALLYDPKVRTQTAELWWLDRMLRTQRPLNEKMTLFWHGHFATSIRKVPASMMVGQINLFRSQALGNFRNLLLAVSKDPAMLVWLDNRYNYAAHPNENYAREVMELFALGLGNYTEDDIKNVARSFTGWSLDKNNAFVFLANKHDDGIKTVLGHTGSFDGADVVNIIVQQPIHQRFICRKLLEFFVYSDPEPELTEALAQVYALSGYDLARTVGTILRSNVFYSSRAYRALPKSPIEFVVGLQRLMQVKAVPKDTVYWLQRMGQELMAPPSVKGWDGGPTWINTSTLLARFNYVNRLVKTAAPAPAPMTAMPAMLASNANSSASTNSSAITAPSASAIAKPATAAVDPATFPAWTPDQVVQQAGGMDPNRVLEALVADSVQDDVTSTVRKTLVDYLNSTGASLPVPLGPENYQEKIRGALALTLNLPSNQLN